MLFEVLPYLEELIRGPGRARGDQPEPGAWTPLANQLKLLVKSQYLADRQKTHYIF